MDGNSNENNINQSEDLDKGSRNVNQLNRMTVRNLFQEITLDVMKELRTKDALNKKLQGTVRLLLVNAHGCFPTNYRKINQLKEVVNQHEIDVLLLNKVNTKWLNKKNNEID